MTNTNPDLDRRVAEWMGWVENKKYGFWLTSHYSSKGIGSPSANHNACALVKSRLVERGFCVDVMHTATCVSATWYATKDSKFGYEGCPCPGEAYATAPTEPEAIALLACKVAEWEKEQ